MEAGASKILFLLSSGLPSLAAASRELSEVAEHKVDFEDQSSGTLTTAGFDSISNGCF